MARRLGGPGTVCRVLSGQRYPEVSREQGLGWVVECIEAVLPAAREHDFVLGLENHYKDGFWKYPEFAQKQDVFLERILAMNNYRGWVSIEDGMNGMDEMAESLAFLRRMGAKYFPE